MIKPKLKNLIHAIFIVFVFHSVCLAQVPDSLIHAKFYPFVVDSIVITGNKITEEFIILRELNFEVGDTLTQSNSFYNRERVYSLGIFNHVYFIPTKLDDRNILLIEIEEGWYIYPIPFVEAKEKDLNKLSYGMFFRLRNFRGRNEDLAAKIAFGYDPTLFLSYYNPNIIGKENIFIRLTTVYSDVSNKSPSAETIYGDKFSQKVIGGQFLIGRRFGLFHRLSLTLGFNYIETPVYIPGINASGNRIDNLADISLSYEYDTRDLIQFPKNGIYSNLSFAFKGMGIDDINYKVAYLDFREYRKLVERLIAKWRFASRFTFGDNVPYYDNSILGVSDKIRGHYDQKYEGRDYLFSGVEFYYPIVEELNVDLTFIPIIPDQLLSYRLGFYTQIFAETGAASYKNDPLTFSSFKSGYGAGLTFLILPYSVLRVDFAFDEYKNLQVVMDVGISF